MTINWPMLKRMTVPRWNWPLTRVQWVLLIATGLAWAPGHFIPRPETRFLMTVVLWVMLIWVFSRRRAIWRYWREGKQPLRIVGLLKLGGRVTLEVAAFGWHATIFLGWGTLVVCLILAAVSVLSVKYFSTVA